MSEEISWLSVVIAISSGIIGVGVTCFVNYVIANKNRKVQSELTIKEMELKENIEYHKITIDHLMDKVTKLDTWNIDIDKILAINLQALMIDKFDKGELKDEITNSSVKLLKDFLEKIPKLYIYLSKSNREKTIHIQKELIETLKITQDGYEKVKLENNAITAIHTIVLSQIEDYIDKIDLIINKQLE